MNVDGSLSMNGVDLAARPDLCALGYFFFEAFFFPFFFAFLFDFNRRVGSE